MTKDNPAQIGSEPRVWAVPVGGNATGVAGGGGGGGAYNTTSNVRLSPGQFRNISGVAAQGAGGGPGYYPVEFPVEPKLSGYDRAYSLSDLEAAQEFIDKCQG